MAYREICSSSLEPSDTVSDSAVYSSLYDLTCLAGDHETDVEVTRTDVYQEFDSVRQKNGIEEWRAKFVQRKYAFEEQDVAKGESEWMKVVYGFNGECCRY